MDSPKRSWTTFVFLLAAAGALTMLSIPAQSNDLPNGHESRFVSTLEKLPEAETKSLYLRCSSESLLGTLSTIEVALCSIVYETLLQDVFDGDFFALLDWSRNH
jgi:hypothetical protein